MSEKYLGIATSAEHRFDNFIKLCVKHKTRNACRDVENERIYINEIPLDSVEELLEYWDKYPVEEEMLDEEMLLEEKISLEMGAILKVLQVLPKRIRKVIILSVIYEKTTREIADHLNIHHSTVWKYKSMGISILREYLTESGNVRPEGKTDK